MNKKESKLLGLQIAQCKHPKSDFDVTMSKFNTPNKILSNVHKGGGAHLQCVNNQYAKFEY